MVLSTYKPSRRTERPDPEWVRGTCPCCGSEVVSNSYHVGGEGYVVFHECWESLGERPTCRYRIEFHPGQDPKVIGAKAGR